MGLALVVTPILLRELGASRLGAARAVADWAGYLTLFELGLNGAMMPLLGRALTHGDPARVKATLAAGFRAYLLVLVPMLLGGIVLRLAISHLVTVEPGLQNELRLACVFAIVPLLFMPLSPLKTLIEASQRGYILSALVIAQSVIIAVSGVALARSGLGIAGQTLATAIGAGFFTALMIWDARRSAAGMLPSQPWRADAAVSRAIWNLNTPTLILNVCGRVGFLTDNIVIGSILSAPVIVPFLMTQRLAQIAQGQLQAVGSVSWAGLAQLHARGEQDLFRVRFLELNQLVMVLGLTVLMPIVVFNHAFVALWLGEASYGGFALTSIAACNALVLAVASLWGWLFGGTGQLASVVPSSMAAAAINLVVSVGFTWLLARRDVHSAIWGPVLGTAAGLLLVNVPVTPLLMRRHFGIPIRPLAKTLCAPLAIALPFFAVLMWLAHRRPPHGWFMLLADMGSAAFAFGALCWLILLDSTDRSRWMHRLRLAVGR